MSRTTTREIIKVCTEITRLDRRGKEGVFNFLQEELSKHAKADEQKNKTGTYKKGETEQ